MRAGVSDQAGAASPWKPRHKVVGPATQRDSVGKFRRSPCFVALALVLGVQFFRNPNWFTHLAHPALRRYFLADSSLAVGARAAFSDQDASNPPRFLNIHLGIQWQYRIVSPIRSGGPDLIRVFLVVCRLPRVIGGTGRKKGQSPYGQDHSRIELL